MDEPNVIDRMRSKKGRVARPSFMTPDEFHKLRTIIIRTTQERLGKILLDPTTGAPTVRETISRWERGIIPIPLWVARWVRYLGRSAQLKDSKRGDDE